MTSFLFVFLGFFNKATAYIPGRIFIQNTSNDVVPGKEVPFGIPDDYILYLDPYISEKPPFRGPILTGRKHQDRLTADQRSAVVVVVSVFVST